MKLNKKDTFPDDNYFLFCQHFFFNLDLTKTKIQFSKKEKIVRTIDQGSMHYEAPALGNPVSVHLLEFKQTSQTHCFPNAVRA